MTRRIVLYPIEPMFDYCVIIIIHSTAIHHYSLMDIIDLNWHACFHDFYFISPQSVILNLSANYILYRIRVRVHNNIAFDEYYFNIIRDANEKKSYVLKRFQRDFKRITMHKRAMIIYKKKTITKIPPV